jgi:hypothetical protein
LEWEAGTYGLPSYLFDPHENKERMELEEERTDQTLATPIIAFLKSSSELTPSVAYSMAYMMVRVDKRGKKKLASCLGVQRSTPILSPERERQ